MIRTSYRLLVRKVTLEIVLILLILHLKIGIQEALIMPLVPHVVKCLVGIIILAKDMKMNLRYTTVILHIDNNPFLKVSKASALVSNLRKTSASQLNPGNCLGRNRQRKKERRPIRRIFSTFSTTSRLPVSVRLLPRQPGVSR